MWTRKGWAAYEAGRKVPLEDSPMFIIDRI